MIPDLSIDYDMNYMDKGVVSQGAGNKWHKETLYSNYISVEILTISGIQASTGEIQTIHICPWAWPETISPRILPQLQSLLNRKVTKKCGEGEFLHCYTPEDGKDIIKSCLDKLRYISTKHFSINAYTEKHKMYLENPI